MNETTDATAIFAPLWRRKWLILAVGIIVAAASYAYYKRQHHVFQSMTQVFLGAAAEEQAPGEKANTKSQGANLANQAAIINSIVVPKVHQQLRKEHKAAIARGSTIKAKAPTEKSEFLAITAEARTPKNSSLLANLTAQAYIRRQRVDRQAVIEKAIAITRRQLRRIEAASLPKATVKPSTGGGANSTNQAAKTVVPATPSTTSILQAASLNSKINQLEASLGLAGAQQVQPAKPATALLLSPKPKQNAIFGFVIGLVLAAIAAYALSRFDRRLRTLAGVEGVFQTVVLAGLPKVKRPIVQREGQPAPSRFLLEPLRRLHSGLELGAGNAQVGASACRTIIFTSADAGDGKSTLVAALALVQRDAGERVAVVEANFRRPAQARLLGLDGAQGLAEVLAGSVPVDGAMQRVRPIQPAPLAQEQGAEGGVATAVGARSTGSLSLLAGGGPVANPPALLAHPAMGDLLRGLAQDFDYILIDAPSPLEVSDAMPLLNSVDGVVIVARVGHTRETSAQRLNQLLAGSRAPVLGTAANCLPRKEIQRSGFSSPNGRVWPSKLFGR